MKKLIFLIEDDINIADVYKIALENVGKFKTEIFPKGQDFLDWIEEKNKIPDLILLDLILPDMNGLDLLKKIREEKDLQDIPVFILTNYSGKELEKIGVGLKSEKYLTKSKIKVFDLVKMVQKRLTC